MSGSSQMSMCKRERGAEMLFRRTFVPVQDAGGIVLPSPPAPVEGAG